MRRSAPILFAAAFSLIAIAGSARAEWEPDGFLVTTAYGPQIEPVIVPDGNGNVIIVWEDHAITTDYNIFAQKLDIYGNPQWAPGGVAVCAESSNQTYMDAASDGAGGVIVTWSDYRAGNWDIYAQRIDADGIPRWTAGGVGICIFYEEQSGPDIISDGYGGAIIAWNDNWNVTDWDIYAQRVDEDGATIWASTGIPISEFALDQINPTIVADGTGGAIISWTDDRSGVSNDIYAQRILIDGAGTARWTANGVPICEEDHTQYHQDLVPDLEGGAVIVWEDYRNSHIDIYAQRIDSLGAVQWETDGVNVTPFVPDNQQEIAIAQDGSGGVIIAWADRRDYGTNLEDIYAQRIDSDGHWRWAYQGLPICTNEENQWPLAIAADDQGGAFIVWRDMRYGSMDIYAQYMRNDGAFRWVDGGIDVCSQKDTQDYPVVVADGVGGAIVAWEDLRSGSDRKIYAQRIEPRYGHWGVPEPVIAFATDIAPDEGGYVDLSWYGSQLDDFRYGEVTHYSIWRATNPIPPLASTGEFPVLTALQDVGKDFDDSAFRIEQTAAGDYFWEWIGNADALGLEGYSHTAATRTDSTGSDPAIHYFQVVTHTQTPTTYWISAPDSGYSVDNLSPCPPLAVAAEQMYIPEGLEITWEPNTEPDLGGYVIHRDITSDFVPDEGNLVYRGCEATYFDDDWRWDSGYWYKLATIDIHGNVSEYVILGPDGITGEEIPEAPAASYLSQNYPNPFNPATRIRFGLKEPAPVSIRIYDTAGRLVRVLVEERRGAGHYTEEWDARDNAGRAVASGIYFYRLETGTFGETKKMVLLR